MPANIQCKPLKTKRMRYSAIHKQLIIDQKELEIAAEEFRWALKNARTMAGLPLTKYKSNGILTDADHLQRAILQGAKRLGIDFGTEWGNEIDLSEAE